MSGADLAAMARIALIAGNGRLPCQVADALNSAGRDFQVIAIRGEADEMTRQRANAEIGWGEIGRLYGFLEKDGLPRGLVDRGACPSGPISRRFWETLARSSGCQPSSGPWPAATTAC
ncbi:hypothetical protein QW131_10420 [Roseibium salinum]|nr:hypothetical protein [Roseibium salinum]